MKRKEQLDSISKVNLRYIIWTKKKPYPKEYML